MGGDCMTTRLTLDALEVLDAIERKGSFAAAAAALYRVPSAVTYSVQKLEQDLGVSLFRKQGRRSVLSPAGRVLLEQGRELLLAAERLVETTRQADSGWESRLNIAVDSIVDLDRVYPHLKALYALRPDIEINLYEEVLGGSWEAIKEGRADLVLGAVEPPANSQGLRFSAIQQAEWIFAVAAHHPLASHEGVLAEDEIRQHRAVVVRDSSRHLPPLTRRVFARQAALRVATVQQKIDAQLRGLGVGYLPVQRIRGHLARAELIPLTLAEVPDSTPLHVVWKAGNKGRALRWMVDRLADAGAWGES
jgi:DNA-binding transcriptional LysR family regulator